MNPQSGGQFIGVVSDTHGVVRPETIAALEGAQRILHAGDIGSPSVITQLEKIAPVTAIRGNIDQGDWASAYPPVDLVQLGDKYYYIIHDVRELDIDPEAAGINVIVSGHSHRPVIDECNDIIYLNPGSCGPRRFSLPVSLARIWITGDKLQCELVELLN